MKAGIPTKSQDPAEAALQQLLMLPMEQRLEAVAVDLQREDPVYRQIDPHALADALGVDQPERPTSTWSLIRYARIENVETYAQDHSPASELVYLLEDKVGADRFQELLACSEALDASDSPSFSFLTQEERRALELAIARQELEANSSNGMCCIARYAIESPDGIALEFEGMIEDDGTCLHLLTPYDKRQNRFMDLSGCVTDEW